VDAMTLNLDSAQTILDLARIAAPPGMQGRSLVPLLHGDSAPDWRTEFFYEHHYGPSIIPPSEGVRTEHWCFIHWLEPNPEVEELYDMTGDPLESRNLAGDPKYATILAGLRTRWRQYQQQLR
jgi:arylsulfatase A-like enzyme